MFLTRSSTPKARFPGTERLFVVARPRVTWLLRGPPGRVRRAKSLSKSEWATNAREDLSFCFFSFVLFLFFSFSLSLGTFIVLFFYSAFFSYIPAVLRATRETTHSERGWFSYPRVELHLDFSLDLDLSSSSVLLFSLRTTVRRTCFKSYYPSRNVK